MEEKKNIPPQQQINIEISDAEAEGIYSNLAVITHSSSEFVVDFIRVMPGVPKAKVKARIILTPEHTKRLLFALKENVGKFEANFGEIRIPEQPKGVPITFGPPGQA